MTALDVGDRALFRHFNSLTGQSVLIDSVVGFISTNPIGKGVVVMALFWAIWHSGSRFGRDTRERLLAILGVAILAIAAGRFLALMLPYRYRPIHADGLTVNMAQQSTVETLQGWSSFPSDHAVLFFAIATGFFLIHWVLGLVTLLHAIFVVSLPRIYLGFHFPGDIIAGGLIGAALCILVVPVLTRAMIRNNTVGILECYPMLFYPAVFFVTLQTATMFESLRSFGSATIHFLRLIFA